MSFKTFSNLEILLIPLTLGCQVVGRGPFLTSKLHFERHRSDNEKRFFFKWRTFKVQGSRKFENLCLWFFLIVSRSIMLFVFWIVVSVRKRCPLFLKKAFVAITSVSLKMKLESRKWKSVQHLEPLVLRRAGAPGLILIIIIYNIIT